jgi:hypothetical protein
MIANNNNINDNKVKCGAIEALTDLIRRHVGWHAV